MDTKERQLLEMPPVRMDPYTVDLSSYGLQDLFSSGSDPDKDDALVQPEKADNKVRQSTDVDMNADGCTDDTFSGTDQVYKIAVGREDSYAYEETTQGVPVRLQTTPAALPRVQCSRQPTISHNGQCQLERQATAVQWVKFKDTFWRDRWDKTRVQRMLQDTPDELPSVDGESTRDTDSMIHLFRLPEGPRSETMDGEQAKQSFQPNAGVERRMTPVPWKLIGRGHETFDGPSTRTGLSSLHL